MKRKTQFIYLCMAIITSALCIVITLHILLAKKEQTQSYMESKLPTGQYMRDSENPLIRVVIKTNGFKQIAHEQIQVSAENGLLIKVGDEIRESAPGEIVLIAPDDERFQKGTVCIESKEVADRIVVNSLNRGYGIPSYRGSFELYSAAEGIVLVNELPVEEYLYAVVPSEMPASYAQEALKCQAICARSYAYCQMAVYSYPEYEAHVDDSVSFQVYGNCMEQVSTIQAVNETLGKKLWYKNQVVKTYYFSTSCGTTTSIEAWGTELTKENQYLCGLSVCNEAGEDYEKELPWYRWKAVIPEKTLENLIELNTGKEIGTLKSIAITKQGKGGVVLQIVATGTKGKITVDTENKIRKALGGSGYRIEKQDGTVIESTSLLPSAFFSIAKNGGNYIIEGGGYGHGIGMSQNGANEIAKEGKTYVEILRFFYPGTKVE